jgi:rod shape-determining protein MreC
VKLNMPIVTNGGLVGRVTAVSPLTAQVSLITKDKSGLGAVIGALGTSNALGVVSGTGKREILEMGYVPGSVEVKTGESVYTTGQDGIYPPGLKARRSRGSPRGFGVRSVENLHSAERELSSMQEVAVLIYEPAAAPGIRQVFAEREEEIVKVKSS